MEPEPNEVGAPVANPYKGGVTSGWRRMTVTRFVGTMAISALFLETGCGLFGSARPKPPVSVIDTVGSTTTVSLHGGVGLALPHSLDNFELTGRPDQQVRGVTARYTRSGTVATVSAIRLGQGQSMLSFASVNTVASAARSGKVLDATIGQLRAAHPDLSLTSRRDVYLLRFGAIQVGQTTNVSYMTSTHTPATINIDAFCCVNGMWAYEYRFQHSDGTAPDQADTRFMRDLPWSVDPRTSIDEPR